MIYPHPDADQPVILLCRDGTGRSLPSIVWTERHFWQTTSGVNRRLHDETGIRAVALRCVAIDESEDAERFVYEMDTSWGAGDTG